MTTKEVEKEVSLASKVTSYTIIGVLSLCPFLFYAIVARNQTQLDREEIRQKIGTLYVGLRAKVISVKY